MELFFYVLKKNKFKLIEHWEFIKLEIKIHSKLEILITIKNK